MPNTTGLISSEKRRSAPSDMYKVEKVEGGWQIFFYFPKGQYAGTVKRPVDDGYVYIARQSAYLRCKRLNDAHHSTNIFTLYAKIKSEQKYCRKIIEGLRTHVTSFIVHDPLYEDEARQDIRYITCQQRCRFHEEDFDPQVKQWQPQPVVEKDFRSFLDDISHMPEVESLEISEHSFLIYYP